MARKEEDSFRYDKMVEKALRGVVRQAMQEVVDHGLSEDHHFYITFFTDQPGVEIPTYLKERYPHEMTIVLQHQFYDLEVDEEKFSVMLSFNNVPERMRIPLNTITIFADPSVNFALQFQPLLEEEEEGAAVAGDDKKKKETAGSASGGDAKKKDKDKDDGSKKGEVVSLDSFRKKDKE